MLGEELRQIGFKIGLGEVERRLVSAYYFDVFRMARLTNAVSPLSEPSSRDGLTRLPHGRQERDVSDTSSHRSGFL